MQTFKKLSVLIGLVTALVFVSCSKLNGTVKVVNISGEELKSVEIKTTQDKILFKNLSPNESRMAKFEIKEDGYYEIKVTRKNNTTFEKTVGYYPYGFKATDELFITDRDVVRENTIN